MENKEYPEILGRLSTDSNIDEYQVNAELSYLMTESEKLYKKKSPMTGIKTHELIGAEEYTEVWLGETSSKPPSQVAVKFVKFTKSIHTIEFSENIYSALLKEYKILSKLQSPYIVKFLGIAAEPKTKMLQLVLELCPRGDLKKYLYAISQTSTENILRAIYQIACGLKVIHSKRIIHCDLRPENILIGEDNRLRIADFGGSHKSKIKLQNINDVITNPYYRAPEHLGCAYSLSVGRSVIFTTAIDIYAFALIANELFNGIASYTWLVANTNEENRHKKLIDEICYNQYRDKTHKNCPDKISQLITRSWNQNPFLRPKAKNICKELEKINQDYAKNNLDSAITIEEKPLDTKAPTVESSPTLHTKPSAGNLFI